MHVRTPDQEEVGGSFVPAPCEGASPDQGQGAAASGLLPPFGAVPGLRLGHPFLGGTGRGSRRASGFTDEVMGQQLSVRLSQLVAADLLRIDLEPLEEGLVEEPPLRRIGHAVGGLNVLGQRQGHIQRLQ